LWECAESPQHAPAGTGPRHAPAAQRSTRRASARPGSSARRDLLQPAAQLIRIRQLAGRRRMHRLPDAHADAAETIDDLEGVFVTDVVTGKNRRAAPKRR